MPGRLARSHQPSHSAERCTGSGAARGVGIGHALGLGQAGATVFGAMLASASYIAAPASVRASLPEADAGRCITASLGLTFPFNLALGIPAYAAFARWLGG